MNANLIAPFYRAVEHLCLGNSLERRRTAFLNDVRGARKAISCGEGDGRFLAALLASNPDVRATAVDASLAMIGLSCKRVASMGHAYRARATYHCEPIDRFEPTELYDLIATHFFLDCFSAGEIEGIVERIANWAAPHTQWVVSEFAQPAGAVGHLWTGAVIRSLYGAFRVTTGLRVTHLPDHRPALARAGFTLSKQEYALGGLLVSELWEKSGKD